MTPYQPKLIEVTPLVQAFYKKDWCWQDVRFIGMPSITS